MLEGAQGAPVASPGTGAPRDPQGGAPRDPPGRGSKWAPRGGSPDPPWGAPPGGPPGTPRGGGGCTFSRVFNNSPSRDRCWCMSSTRAVSRGTPDFWPPGPPGAPRGPPRGPPGTPPGAPPGGPPGGVPPSGGPGLCSGYILCGCVDVSTSTCPKRTEGRGACDGSPEDDNPRGGAARSTVPRGGRSLER